jgi:hypothetical protein
MRDRIVRDASLVALGFLVFQAFNTAWHFLLWPGLVALDFNCVRDSAVRWYTGGGYFWPHQLAGPYVPGRDEALYPPVAIWLFLPFAVLPAILWWLIPGAIVAWSLHRLRPARWTWPIFAVIAAVPHSWQMIILGNTSMWVVAAGFAGAVYGWPSVFVLLKPSLAPFALFGAKRRSWWLALGLLVLASLPFGLLWVDWVKATIIYPTTGGILYSLPYVPAMCAPIVAWLGSSRCSLHLRPGARELTVPAGSSTERPLTPHLS